MCIQFHLDSTVVMYHKLKQSALWEGDQYVYKEIY